MRLIDADELIVFDMAGIAFVPKEFIDDAPTIDAEPVRHGRWVEEMNGSLHVTDEWYGRMFSCSECGSEMIGTLDYCPWNYCPNCGARMETEGGEE